MFCFDSLDRGEKKENNPAHRAALPSVSLLWATSMGVSGLARWVDEHAPDATPFAGLPAGSRLLIDGHGACFFMLREAGARARAGDYAALARAFTALVTNLQSAGMVPEIFLDGPATRLKAATLDSRAAERRRRLEDVQAACLDGRTLAAAQLPEPPLMVELLAQCAEAEGVRLTRCDGEADAEVACECAAAEATRPGLCFVVAEDSDFFLFRGIRYVRFSDLLLLCGGGGGGGGGQGLRLCERQAGPLLLLGRVWTRQLLCEASGLSAGRLVDWAGLVGNDHTSAFQLASFGSVVAESSAQTGSRRRGRAPRLPAPGWRSGRGRMRPAGSRRGRSRSSLGRSASRARCTSSTTRRWASSRLTTPTRAPSRSS